MSIRIVPLRGPTISEWVRQIAVAVNSLCDGRSNGTGSVTLTASQTTTVVSDNRVGTDSVICFMPTTANAAAEIGAGGMYIGTVTGGSFTITHASNAQTDRDFTYSLQG